MTSPHRIVFVFVDGVGLGAATDVNPLAGLDLPEVELPGLGEEPPSPPLEATLTPQRRPETPPAPAPAPAPVSTTSRPAPSPSSTQSTAAAG